MSNKQGAGFHGVDALKYAVLGGETTTVVPSEYVVGVSLSGRSTKLSNTQITAWFAKWRPTTAIRAPLTPRRRKRILKPPLAW